MAMHRTRLQGLSPPTRGNPGVLVSHLQLGRSIPAHAGEPGGRGHGGLLSGVYPRPRGGTSSSLPRGDSGTGLSPPTRGNRESVDYANSYQRSISAHAGEPGPALQEPRLQGVYLRPRGGTSSSLPRGDSGTGLSPPTRGNRESVDYANSYQRSISAHAGEPGPALQEPRLQGVYLRPRGGTSSSLPRGDSGTGLSPPTRGNLAQHFKSQGCKGSISAHAGEPPVAFRAEIQVRVYLRPRGGTPNRMILSTGTYRLSL